MKTYIKNFNGFINESEESVAAMVKLLDQKKALIAKKEETKEAGPKTEIEKQIVILQGEIDKINAAAAETANA